MMILKVSLTDCRPVIVLSAGELLVRAQNYFNNKSFFVPTKLPTVSVIPAKRD
jgi:hypothetical protein